jgi:hypothetical protein
MITWSQHSTHLQLPVKLRTSSGQAIDLTGLLASAVTMKTRPASEGSKYASLSGTPTILDPGDGYFSYKFLSSDVAQWGNYKLIVTVSYGANDVWTSFEQDFVITQSQ